MLWGNSPPLDLQCEIQRNEEVSELNPLEILIVGAADARHIIKTLSMCYIHPTREINFHVVETFMEDIARSILFISISLEKDLGLQEGSRYFLEILGNTLLTPATGKYLIHTIQRLINVVTQTFPCPWLNLEGLKYRERDLIEGIFKFWARALCEGVPIIDYWDGRIRKALGPRYDYRDGVFDWDYHMVLNSKKLPNLTIQEYKFWRKNGVAFTWLETDPSRSNPTLLCNIIPVGDGFVHYAYRGDINNGPFFTWALDETEKNKKLRSTDVAEGQVLKALYQIRSRQTCPEDIVAAHRDRSILNGTLVTEMPDSSAEQEPWILEKNSINRGDACVWVDIEKIKIIFHPAWFIDRYKNKEEFKNKFDVTFIANNMTNQLPNLNSMIKRGSTVLIESRRFLTELRAEDHTKFAEDLKKLTSDIGLRESAPFDPHTDNFARYIKD